MGPSEIVSQGRALSKKTPRSAAIIRAAAGTPAADEIRAELAKILTSRLFARSERICRFLRCGVEHALNGSAEPLKEYRVGIEVFDRKADYDPRVDPIVRVEARRLRAKLKAYYASAGKADTVVVEFPKGAYVPAFRYRSAARSVQRREPATSIAVLPFANLMGTAADSFDDYFIDGLAEELNLLLTRVEGLQVVAWHSAVQFRGQEHDLSEIRERLKVGFVLKGAVRRTSEQVRVTVQLIDTSSGGVMWSEAYNRAMSGVFALQEEIARAIVDTLRITLGAKKRAGPRVVPNIVPVPDLECYNLCLEGRFHAHKRTPEGLQRSAQCYEEAIECDPDCSVAYSGLADAYCLLADYGIAPPTEYIPKAEAAALHALELDRDSADALATLAIIRSNYHWDWVGSEVLFRRAISINPNNAKVRHWFATDHLALLGRFDEALAEIKVARMLDPLSMLIHENHAYVHVFRRDYDTALTTIQQLTALDPGFLKAYGTMGRIYSLQGKYKEAIECFEKARPKVGDTPSLTAALGQVRALNGDLSAALRALDELRELERTRFVAATCFGILHMGLGEIGTCLDWLEKAADQHEFNVGAFKAHPLYDPLRGEPRFQRILRRANFCEEHLLPRPHPPTRG